MAPLTSITSCSPEQLRHQVASFFAQTFSGLPHATCLAPGRINLIGEHVDYNSGCVLPFAIGLHSAVAIRPTTTASIRACSQLDGVVYEFSLDNHSVQPWPGWTRYLQGTWELWRQENSFEPRGFDLAVSSNLPLGAGLSSSAALCVAILFALRTTREEPAASFKTNQNSIWELAQLCQQVEHRFAGVPCGLMDQLVVLASQREHLLAIDFHASTIEQIPWPGKNLSCLLIHTGVQHDLATSEYGLRRATCEAAARKLGLTSLGLATTAGLLDGQSKLTSTELQRARHVVSEIQRTKQAIAACRRGEAQNLGLLMNASHASLRDDYEVSCAELDYLVDKVRTLPGVLGARMTGGGFGGSLIALLPTEAFARPQLEQLLGIYESRFGLTPRWMLCQPCSGAIELNS